MEEVSAALLKKRRADSDLPVSSMRLLLASIRQHSMYVVGLC